MPAAPRLAICFVLLACRDSPPTTVTGTATDTGTVTVTETGTVTETETETVTGTTSDPASVSGTGTGTGTGCTELASSTIDLPEASGATWVPPSFGLPGHVVAIGDSGTKGAFVLLDERGRVIGRGRLPLDRAASDDHEGLARIGQTYYAITSGGHVRQYRRTGAERFLQDGPAYPLHPDLLCDTPRRTNCGYDVEGICLGEVPEDQRAGGAGGCDGHAASKTRGALLCLKRGPDGRLTADPDRSIRVAPPGALSGCAIEGDLLHAGSNLFAANAVVRIRGWRDPATARQEPLGPLGPGFAEAIAAGPGGLLIRLSDTAAPRSAVGVVSCPGAGP